MNVQAGPDAKTAEPIHMVRLLPDVREAMEAYAREQRIPMETAIAEACRSFTGLAG